MRVSEAAAHYDVVIIGGGMVGASFALDLCSRTSEPALSLLVVEAGEPADTANQTSFDARSTALSFSSREIYERMGQWQQLQTNVAAIKQIQVSDQGHFGTSCLAAEEQGVEALGYVMENRILGEVLNAALDAAPTIDFLTTSKIESAKPTASGMDLELSAVGALQQVSCKLLVLADGGRSPICEQLGIARKQEQYQQYAVISNVAFQLPHENVAYERFTEEGPLAILPLPEFERLHRGSLVWTVAEGKQQELQNCEDKDFLQRLNKAFGNRLGRMEKVGQRFTYPLALTEAQEQVRPGLVLLGNVAHTLHPVAGQGLNLALRDSACLAQTLNEAAISGQALGSMEVLQKYMDAQQSDQQRMIFFTDQMIKLFSSGNPGKVFARKAGLLGLELLPKLRNEFAQQAMGIG